MTPPHQTEHPPTPSNQKALLTRAALFAVTGVLLYLFLFGPLVALMQAQPLRFKAKKTETIQKLLLQKLDLLEQAKRSPLLAHRAQRSQEALLRSWLSPSRLQKAWRGFLRQGSLSQWSFHEQAWRNLIDQVQKRFPDKDLRHLHAFIDLQDGTWLRLVREASRYQKEPVTTQALALYWIWVGHAAFFAGLHQAATLSYEKALQAAEKYPSWGKQSRSNWRFPGEILAARYHLALLSLSQNKAQQAVPYLEKNIQHWEKTYKRPHQSPLWYHSVLWLAIALHQAQLPQSAQVALKKALLFKSDTSLAQLLLAQFASPNQARPYLDALIQANPHFSFAYPDIQLTARLLRGLQASPRANHPTSQPQKPPATSAPTSLVSRPPTCLPLSKAAQADLTHALTIFHRPQRPTKLVHLYQAGNYSISFAPIPTALLKSWLARLCPKDPSYAPQRAQLKVLLAMQLIRQGYFQKAQQLLVQPSLKRYAPQHQGALLAALRTDLRVPTISPRLPSNALLQIAPWYRGLGAEGCLATHKINSVSSRRCKQLLPFFRFHPTSLKLFQSTFISDQPDQFSLLTLQLKDALLQRWRIFPKKDPSSQRLHALQKLYRTLPHAAYLLDQTSYSLAWGTLAYAFKRQP
ncbi:MAG: hypothetical protein H6727_13185 [Myxococcales bacterium]|nr:hypothetical protein [Myxococcales bacterium]